MECGGKRSATPLLHRASLRSQKRCRRCALPPHSTSRALFTCQVTHRNRPARSVVSDQYGVRREAKRHAAFAQGQLAESKAVSPLRSATALHIARTLYLSGDTSKSSGTVSRE